MNLKEEMTKKSRYLKNDVKKRTGYKKNKKRGFSIMKLYYNRLLLDTIIRC